jgi:hypothetical protein
MKGRATKLDKLWCERGDSNPHGFTRQILSLVRLPIPPLSHADNYTKRMEFFRSVQRSELAPVGKMPRVWAPDEETGRHASQRHLSGACRRRKTWSIVRRD